MSFPITDDQLRIDLPGPTIFQCSVTAKLAGTPLSIMYRGTGLYSLRAAAGLIQAAPRNLHRWLFGYHHDHKGPDGERVRAFSPPLWKTQIDAQEYDEEVIGFQDLLEARFVRSFVVHGIPLDVVKRCLDSARAIYAVDYPFTTLRFKTDGRTIFGEALRQMQSEGALVDLRSRQTVFRDIIHPSLYTGIEYKGMQATKWYPAGKRAHIVLDPLRQFGKPIIEDTGTPTDALYASFLAEGRDDRALQLTAQIFDLAPRLVQSAVRFETNLANAQA